MYLGSIHNVYSTENVMKLRDASGEMLQYSHRKKNEEVTQKLELLRMTAAV